MADQVMDQQTVPVTPPGGQGIWWFDSQGGIPCYKDGIVGVVAHSKNAAIAAQGAGFAADTYVTDSYLTIPSFSLLARATFLWRISASKTGAGVAAPAYIIRIGPAKAVTDGAIITLNGPAQTAVADIGTLMIMATLRSVGAAGVLQATAWWEHRGTAVSSTIGTGFANDGTGHVEGSSAGFDTTNKAGQFIGLSLNGGAAASWTLTQVVAQADW